MSDQETAVEQTETTAPQEQGQSTDLTVQDLQAVKAIIDVASERGAFKPNEMMTVGQVYAKIEGFLGAVSQQQAKGE